MEYQVSARKYRPGTFQDVIGQPHVVQTLVNAIGSKRIAHAFLFSGTRGVGKTTVARILAKALNCEQDLTGTPCDVCANCQEIALGTSVDVIEIDGASNTGVDDVREIRENVKFTPFRGRYRVYIIDEVHMLSNSAFNALLKTLEEPPSHVVFIFATTEIHKIPATILSRCQHYNFRRISRAEIVRRLRHVADQDGLSVEDRSLTAVARASEGSMRDALSLLDQAVAFGGKTIRHDDLETLLGSVPQELVRDMIAAILSQNGAAAVRMLATLLDQGHDLRAYCAELVERVRNLLVISIVPPAQRPKGFQGLLDVPEDDLRQLIQEAGALTTDQLQDLFRIFSEAEDALRLSTHPRFVLEAAAVRATRILTPGRPQVAAPAPPPGARPASAPVKPVPPPPISKSSVVTSEPPKPVPQPPARSNPAQTPSKPTPMPTAQPAAPVRPPNMTWEQILDRMEASHPKVAAFMARGTLVEHHHDRIVLGYSAGSALDWMRRDDSLEAVRAVCRELSGHSVQVKIDELTGTAAGPSLAQLRAEKDRAQKKTMLEQTRTHPVVKQALDVLGGDVIEIRQAPVREENPS